MITIHVLVDVDVVKLIDVFVDCVSSCFTLSESSGFSIDWSQQQKFEFDSSLES